MLTSDAKAAFLPAAAGGASTRTATGPGDGASNVTQALAVWPSTA